MSMTDKLTRVFRSLSPQDRDIILHEDKTFVEIDGKFFLNLDMYRIVSERLKTSRSVQHNRFVKPRRDSDYIFPVFWWPGLTCKRFCPARDAFLTALTKEFGPCLFGMRPGQVFRPITEGVYGFNFRTLKKFYKEYQQVRQQSLPRFKDVVKNIANRLYTDGWRFIKICLKRKLKNRSI